MELRPPALGYLRWSLVAWVVGLVLVGYLPKVAPLPKLMALPFLTTVVQGLILWACFNAISRGSRAGRVFLTILASVQLVGGIVTVALYPQGSFAFAMAIVGIAIRGAVISLVNEREVRAIRPLRQTPAPEPPQHDHDWRSHGQLDGWIRCATCGTIEAKAGEIALINRKES